MNNVYTIQSKEAVIALHKAGFTIKQITESTGVGHSSVQHYIEKFRKLNPEFVPAKKQERLEQEKLLCNLYKAGVSWKELAEKSGIPYGSIGYVLSKWGISVAAKEARQNSGEIPAELMKPVLDWLTNHAAANVAEKMADFAKSLTA